MELGETCMFFFLYLELGETGSFSRLLFYIIYIIYTWNLEKLEVFFQTVILCYTWNCDKLQVYSDKPSCTIPGTHPWTPWTRHCPTAPADSPSCCTASLLAPTSQPSARTPSPFCWCLWKQMSRDVWRKASLTSEKGGKNTAVTCDASVKRQCVVTCDASTKVWCVPSYAWLAFYE